MKKALITGVNFFFKVDLFSFLVVKKEKALPIELKFVKYLFCLFCKKFAVIPPAVNEKKVCRLEIFTILTHPFPIVLNIFNNENA